MLRSGLQILFVASQSTSPVCPKRKICVDVLQEALGCPRMGLNSFTQVAQLCRHIVALLEVVA